VLPPSPPPRIILGVVILAAGASSRMGRPKMLLPWGSTSVIGHLIAQWEKAGAEQIGVVCAAGDQGIKSEMDRIGFPSANWIVNTTPEVGMFSSIQCAARWPGWKAQLSHWAVVLGDQPHLQLETLRALMDFAAVHPGAICQPARDGRRRHPVILSQRAFHMVADSLEENLKKFLQSRPEELESCSMDDAGLDLDIDRPEDYELAVRLVADGKN
jgi:molybdenum cofactor cytidylyltransferase